MSRIQASRNGRNGVSAEIDDETKEKQKNCPWTSMKLIENLGMRLKRWSENNCKNWTSHLRDKCPCVTAGCARAKKATQKCISKKVTTVMANALGERIYMDTSGPYSETVVGSRYWFKFVDDKIRKSWD